MEGEHGKVSRSTAICEHAHTHRPQLRAFLRNHLCNNKGIRLSCTSTQTQTSFQKEAKKQTVMLKSLKSSWFISYVHLNSKATLTEPSTNTCQVGLRSSLATHSSVCLHQPPAPHHTTISMATISSVKLRISPVQQHRPRASAAQSLKHANINHVLLNYLKTNQHCTITKHIHYLEVKDRKICSN